MKDPCPEPNQAWNLQIMLLRRLHQEVTKWHGWGPSWKLPKDLPSDAMLLYIHAMSLSHQLKLKKLLVSRQKLRFEKLISILSHISLGLLVEWSRKKLQIKTYQLLKWSRVMAASRKIIIQDLVVTSQSTKVLLIVFDKNMNKSARLILQWTLLRIVEALMCNPPKGLLRKRIHKWRFLTHFLSNLLQSKTVDCHNILQLPRNQKNKKRSTKLLSYQLLRRKLQRKGCLMERLRIK